MQTFHMANLTFWTKNLLNFYTGRPISCSSQKSSSTWMAKRPPHWGTELPRLIANSSTELQTGALKQHLVKRAFKRRPIAKFDSNLQVLFRHINLNHALWHAKTPPHVKTVSPIECINYDYQTSTLHLICILEEQIETSTVVHREENRLSYMCV